MIKMDTNTISLIDLLTYIDQRQSDAVIMIYRTNTYQTGLINIAGGWISIAMTSKLPNSLAQYIVYARDFNEAMLAKIVQREWDVVTKKEYSLYLEQNSNEVYAARQFIMDKVRTMLEWKNAKISFLPNFKIPENVITKLPPTHISEILDEINSRIKKEQEFKKLIGSKEDYIIVTPMAANILVKHPELDDLSWQIFLMVKTSHKKVEDIIKSLLADHPDLDKTEIEDRLLTLIKLGVLTTESPKKRKAKSGSKYSKGIIQKFIDLLKKKL